MPTVAFVDNVRKLIDNWVLECIMGDIEQFLKLPKGGNYPVAALLFSVIDLMGGLLKGNVEGNHTHNMQTFIRKYLYQIDSKYGDLAPLLVDMFRHPITHTTTSRSYVFGGYTLRSGIYWEEDVSHRTQLLQRRNCHLVKAKYKGQDYLIVNDHVLFEDLRRAIKQYRDDLLGGKDQKLKCCFENAYEAVTEVKKGKKFGAEIQIVHSWPYTQDKCFRP
jgi:hypothetical protein